MILANMKTIMPSSKMPSLALQIPFMKKVFPECIVGEKNHPIAESIYKNN